MHCDNCQKTIPAGVGVRHDWITSERLCDPCFELYVPDEDAGHWTTDLPDVEDEVLEPY